MIYQILYVSTPDKTLEVSEVKAIVEKARINNQDNSITGFLCGNSKFFIQCIEGEEVKVKELFKVISSDERHHNVKALRQASSNERIFSSWSMGVVLGMEKHLDIIRRFTGEMGFDPYELSEQECLDMLVEFSQLRSLKTN